MDILCLVFLGVVTGCMSALFGIGGGTIIVPAMLYGHYIMPEFDFSIHDAVGISVFQMIFSSVFGTAINVFKKKNIDLKDAMFLGTGGLVGASFSGTLLSVVDSKHLTAVFLLVTLITFYKFAFGAKAKPNKVALSDKRKYITLVLIGALTGIFAISLGIGGGLILTPLIMHYLGFDTKKIMPLSLFFIMFASISGSISFFTSGISDFAVIKAGMTLGLASLLGVLIGSRLLETISLKYHRNILMVIYIFSILATLNKVLSYYGVY